MIQQKYKELEILVFLNYSMLINGEISKSISFVDMYTKIEACRQNLNRLIMGNEKEHRAASRMTN